MLGTYAGVELPCTATYIGAQGTTNEKSDDQGHVLHGPGVFELTPTAAMGSEYPDRTPTSENQRMFLIQEY